MQVPASRSPLRELFRLDRDRLISTSMSDAHPIDLLEQQRSMPDVCMAESLRAANRVVTRLYAEELADIGVSPAQASLLMRLYYLEEATVQRLARHMETERTTLSRNVELLRRSGHLDVSAGRDRRSRIVRLTELGRATLEDVAPRWQQAQRRLKAMLGDDLWTSLLRDTRTIADLSTLDDPR